MVDVSEIFALLSGWTCTGGLPFVLTILACIDIGRRGEAWWWYAVVLFFPVVGPLGYFVATRYLRGGGVDSRGTTGQRRRHAQARLRDLDVQLAHWRGPAVLAESGEELLALGRNADAEARFREARQAGAPPEDVNLGLAEALVAQGRPADAVAPLQELVAQHPDHGMGRGALLLARCLDETDRAAEAEAQLRAVLARRNEAEARVRLARRLLLRGERAEGEALAREVADEARLLSPALRRVQAPWTRAARGLLRGKLDVPRLRATPPWLRITVIVVAILCVLALVAAARVVLNVAE